MNSSTLRLYCWIRSSDAWHSIYHFRRKIMNFVFFFLSFFFNLKKNQLNNFRKTHAIWESEFFSSNILIVSQFGTLTSIFYTKVQIDRLKIFWHIHIAWHLHAFYCFIFAYFFWFFFKIVLFFLFLSNVLWAMQEMSFIFLK